MQQSNMLPYLIGIAGPSGAGKSLFCKLMVANFQGVTRLKLDDFFKNIEEVSKIDGLENWDDPSSLHWDALIQAVRDLKVGKHAIVPNYDKSKNRSIGEKCVFSAPIILIDGFLTLYNQRLRDMLDLKIFFNLSEDTQIKRRRTRQPNVIDDYLHKIMLPGCRRFVVPSKKFADFVVNAELSPQGVVDNCLPIIKYALRNRLQKLKRASIIKTIEIRI